MKKIIAAALLAIAIAGCAREKTTQKIEKAIVPVSVMKVEKGSIRETFSYVGDIKAQEEIVVYSKVSGKLLENTVKEGGLIKKGDTLALIDRDKTGFKFEQALVTSPINGVVGRTYLDRGAYVRPSSNMSEGSPVALIVDMDAVRVKINVIERDLPRVKKKQGVEITVRACPDDVFTGEVDRISPMVDLASRTAPIEIVIPNQGHRLKSGMFARVKIIISEHKNVLIVPVEAIIRKEREENLFVVEGNIARLRKIKTGLKNGKMVEIISGLKEAEAVIVEGGYGLEDSVRVRIR